MKKVTFIVLAAILVSALVVAIGVYYKVKIAPLPIENILPGGPVFYIRVSDIENRVNEFRTTQLWQNIKNIDLELILQKSGLDEKGVEQYRTFTSNFSQAVGELFLSKFFGQEVALALYPDEAGSLDFSTPEAMLDMASNIILITRLKPEAEFMEFVSKLFNNFNQKVQTKNERYREGEITIVELNDKVNIAYVKIRDLLAIGLGKQAAYLCLDVIAKEKGSLAQDESFKSTMSKLSPEAQTVAYGNFELFFSGFRELIEAIPETNEVTMAEKSEVLKSFEKMAGFKTVGFASLPGKISQDKTVMFFDKAKMDPALAKVYYTKPQKNSTINFVPKDVIAYQWSNGFDAKLNWDNFKQELSKAPEEMPPAPVPEEIIKGIEEKLGVSIETDVIPALGDEVGGFLADINLESFVPLPEFLFFVEIKDKSLMAETIEALAKKNNILLASEEYKANRIEYISLPFGKSLQPGYCFLDNYLLISTRPKLIKQSIDALSNKSLSLPANEDFKDVDFGLTAENNAVFFLKTDRLLNNARGLCEWGVSWLSLMSTNLKAYQEKAEQYIGALGETIQTEQAKLKTLETNLELTKEEIKTLQFQVLDISSKQQELVSLESEVKKTKESIEQAKKELAEKEQELERAIQSSPVGKMDPELVKFYLDEAIYPILDGLTSYKAMGSRSVFGKHMLQTESFYKTEE